MIRRASRLVAEGFDREAIEYGNRIEEYDDDASGVEAGFTVRNGPRICAKFISGDEDNTVAIRIFGLIHVTEDKWPQIIRAINDVNNDYRYISFSMDEDGDVNAKYDLPVSLEDGQVGKVAAEIFVRITQIIDEVYPDFMRAMWA